LQTPTSRINSKGNTPNFSRNRSGVGENGLRAYKTGNVSETVEDRAKVRPTINGLYKVVHWLSIAAKMYDLEYILARFKVIDSVTATKITKYSLVMTPTPGRVAGGIISIKPMYSCAIMRPCTYLVTHLLTQSLPLVGPKIIHVRNR